MRKLKASGRVVVGFLVTATLLASVGIASAQSLSSLNHRLDEIQPQVSAGMTDPTAAGGAIDRLDQAEADFAQIVEGGRNDREELISTYDRLESMLNRMYSTYEKKKNACVEAIDQG